MILSHLGCRVPIYHHLQLFVSEIFWITDTFGIFPSKDNNYEFVCPFSRGRYVGAGQARIVAVVFTVVRHFGINPEIAGFIPKVDVNESFVIVQANAARP